MMDGWRVGSGGLEGGGINSALHEDVAVALLADGADAVVVTTAAITDLEGFLIDACGVLFLDCLVDG
jgi:hypothetical protein